MLVCELHIECYRGGRELASPCIKLTAENYTVKQLSLHGMECLSFHERPYTATMPAFWKQLVKLFSEMNV